MTVLLWPSHEAVFSGCGYTTFTFEAVLTFSVSYVTLSFFTDIRDTFKCTFVRLLT